MKLEFQSRWVRVLIELLPSWPAIRRYRVAPSPLERQTHRHLRRQIARQMRPTTPEATP